MKKTILTTVLALATIAVGIAQQKAPTGVSLQDLKPNLRNGFQIAPRGGFDFPFYPTKQIGDDYYSGRYFKVKGGPMGGLSVDYYWDWIGIGIDGDYIVSP